MGQTVPTPTPPCPLCHDPQPHHLLAVDGRDYWACQICAARFLDPRDHPTPAQERNHYYLHENDPNDPAYRAFLSKLAKPLLEKLSPGQKALDYGAGPGPALAAMMREAGHDVTIYDPIFADNKSALVGPYDVITCTETAEHFHNPAGEFARLDRLLRPGGLLAVMTCFQTDDDKFSSWHYRKDPTHVVFYREQTFHYIADQYGWTLEIPVKDVALMQKT